MTDPEEYTQVFTETTKKAKRRRDGKMHRKIALALLSALLVSWVGFAYWAYCDQPQTSFCKCVQTNESYYEDVKSMVFRAMADWERPDALNATAFQNASEYDDDRLLRTVVDILNRNFIPDDDARVSNFYEHADSTTHETPRVPDEHARVSNFYEHADSTTHETPRVPDEHARETPRVPTSTPTRRPTGDPLGNFWTAIKNLFGEKEEEHRLLTVLEDIDHGVFKSRLLECAIHAVNKTVFSQALDHYNYTGALELLERCQCDQNVVC